ncbi:hypothetical protein C474_04000 [Halogeometricum pallidum JCM 14848]|uniref:Uncharacterized protein n=2 Tax=Halogeometricum TaxID=60846 RepID=M0DF26_HALPD|nr:hypothetical protein C474_04000 [Halogeometricum pallidum JCM 14848]
MLNIPFLSVLGEGDTIETLFQTLIGVLITGMTLVVSINQLVLSEEFGSLGRQRERMDKSMAFRKDSEREFQWTGPPEPERFLSTLINTSVDRAKAVQEAVKGSSDQRLRSRVDQLVDRIATSADEITDELEDAPFGEFTIMQAALSYNYSWKIYLVRRLYWEHQEHLSENERGAINDLVDILELFGPAEEFFKAHYLQWELVNLSRRILVTGLPALIVSIFGALYLKPDIVSGTVLGVPVLVWLINGGVTFALIPFFIFTAYVLRTASIAKESGAIGPFVLHESERAPLIDWDE